jgi:thiosulfate dehydrogenase [quinone] large subunit
VPLVALLPMRVMTGLVLLLTGWEKAAGGALQAEFVRTHVEKALHEGKAFGFATGLLRDLVLPNAKLWGYLVVAGEIGVGACLVLGLLTRPAALLGAVMMAAFAFEAGVLLSPHPAVGLGLCCLTLLLCGGGRALGLDALLRGKLPGWMA